ncbi:MAG: hypothetical protein MUP76_05575, partial [Acidimicrobiia bacterium]|nr:hypothetical protein [Acidimicrobiia bacterium]
MSKPNMRPGLLAVAFMVLFSAATAAFAHPQVNGTLHDAGEMVEYPMLFPVAEGASYTYFGDTYWAARSG